MNAPVLAAYSVGPLWVLVVVIILFVSYPVLTLGTFVLAMQSRLGLRDGGGRSRLALEQVHRGRMS